MTDMIAVPATDICTPYRERIDDLDVQIAQLVVLRALTARELGERKREVGLDVVNAKRELEVVTVYEDTVVRAGLPKEVGSTVAGAVIEVCRGIQISDAAPVMHSNGAIDH